MGSIKSVTEPGGESPGNDAMRAFEEIARKHLPLACQVNDPDLWWPESTSPPTDAVRAQGLCDLCPVRAECLAYALAADEGYGIWGGLHPTQRRERQVGMLQGTKK